MERVQDKKSILKNLHCVQALIWILICDKSFLKFYKSKLCLKQTNIWGDTCFYLLIEKQHLTLSSRGGKRNYQHGRLAHYHMWVEWCYSSHRYPWFLATQWELPFCLKGLLKNYPIFNAISGGGDNQNKRKLCLIKWDKIVAPKQHGGLGVRDPQPVNRSLMAKPIWRFLQAENNLWIKLLTTKYLKNKSFGMLLSLAPARTCGGICWSCVMILKECAGRLEMGLGFIFGKIHGF